MHAQLTLMRDPGAAPDAAAADRVLGGRRFPSACQRDACARQILAVRDRRVATRSVLLATATVAVLFLGGRPTASPCAFGQDLAHAVVRDDASLRGAVFDSKGLPVRGARVRVWRYAALVPRLAGWSVVAETPEALRSLLTSGDGRFEATGLSGGEHVLAVEAPGFATTVLRGATAAAQGSPLQRVVLASGRSLDGRVTDAAGGGIGGIRVSVGAYPGGRAYDGVPATERLGTMDTVTDEQGRFHAAPAPHFDGFEAGSFVLVHLQFPDRRMEYTLDLKPDALPPSLEISIPEMRYSLSGTVRDPVGAPLPRATVAIEGHCSLGADRVGQFHFNVQCGPDGRYSANGLPEGVVEVVGAEAVDEGDAATVVALPLGREEVGRGRAGAGQASLDLDVMPYARVGGQVRIGDGSPLQGAEVGYVRVPASGGVTVVRSGRSGEFLLGQPHVANPLRRLPTVTLFLDAPGWVVEAPLSLQLEVGPAGTSTAIDLQIVVRPALPLRGRVLDPGGTPVSGALVVASPRSANSGEDPVQEFARSGADGTFLLSGPRADLRELTCTYPPRRLRATVKLTGAPSALGETQIRLKEESTGRR